MASEDFIIKSKVKGKDIEDIDLASLLWKAMETSVDKEVLTNADTEESYTNARLMKDAECLAGHLIDLGLKPGDIVTFYSSNCLQYVVMLLAVWRVGGIVALMNAMATAADLTNELQRLSSNYVFTNDVNIERAVTVLKDSKIKMISTCEHSDCITISSLLSKSPVAPLPSLSDLNINCQQDTVAILFSSGTTGPPKAVQLTHKNFTYFLSAFLSPMGLDIETLVMYIPFAHAAGLCFTIMLLYTNSLFVMMPRFNPTKYVQLVTKYQTPLLGLLPPVSVMLAKSGLLKEYDLSCVHSVMNGAAPLSPEVAKEVEEELGGDILTRQVYGLTETCAIGTMTPPRSHAHIFKPLAPGSVGMVLPHVDAKVVDIDNGNSLGPDEEGEICFKGETIMKDYLGDAGATAATIDDQGWLHTGDIGYYDQNECFHVVDRLKELIKYNALQVSPSELEAFILTHPAVADVGVVGKPDPVNGQLPMAWVVKRAGQSLTEEEMVNFVANNLAPYKKLRGGVKFVDVIPKSPTGKILRKDIMKEIMKEQGL